MTHFDPNSVPACSALNSAYESAEAELKKTREPASVKKVAQLYALKQAATSVSRATHGLAKSTATQQERQIEYVTQRHSTFLHRLDPQQRTIFDRMETALKNGLQIPDQERMEDVELSTTEKRKNEITRLKTIIEGPLSQKEKSVRLEALLDLEWYFIQLLASQPDDISDDEKAKTAALCSLYMGAISDDFADKITNSTTLKKSLAQFEKATQFFTRFKGYSAQLGNNVFKSSAEKSIGAFWQRSEGLVEGTKLGAQVKEACEGNHEDALALHEDALALYETLKIQQQLLIEAGQGPAAHELNAPMKTLNNKFHFEEELLAVQVKALGVAFKPIALTTVKTESVARRILPYAGALLLISCQVMEMHNDGKSYQEIATTVGVGLATQLIARPLSNAVSAVVSRVTPEKVKKKVPQIVKDVAQVAVEIAVSAGLSQATSYGLKKIALVPSERLPQQAHAMTPFNATREALPTCPSVPAPMCETNPPPLTSPIMYDIIPPAQDPSIAPAAPSSSWLETISSTASAAGSKLKEIGSQAAQTRVGQAAIGTTSVGLSVLAWAGRKLAHR